MPWKGIKKIRLDRNLIIALLLQLHKISKHSVKQEHSVKIEFFKKTCIIFENYDFCTMVVQTTL